ncbi:MAG: DNA polymerase III subunit alpha [Alphaproteobacteria bacterium]|nr:DNA polymerase III subunit alpha [Alphaproteobacteria bacterium]
MSETGFIHLRVHTSYSLAEGAIKIKEDKPKDGSKAVRADLIGLCKANNMPAVAVTDSGNLFGALEFAMDAAAAGIQPIIGCKLALARPDQAQGPAGQVVTDRIVLIAQNEAGYKNLVWLVSHSFLAEDRGVPHITWDELGERAEGLIALSGGADGPVGRLLLDGQEAAGEAALQRLAGIYPGRLYVEIMRHAGGAVGNAEQRIEGALIDLAYKHNLPLVATNDVYFGTEDMYEAHDALLCIADKAMVAEPRRRRLTPDHRFKSASEMRELFADLPEACDNTLVIARRCAVMPQQIDPILPAFETTGGRSEADELREQARAGLAGRIKAAGVNDKKAYLERLEYELDVIIKMGFAGYFLITSDFIKWAKGQGIPVGPGRGSGAGSVVAWSLLITDLDPIRFGLLFERFLNPERVSMPDFDIDFCQERRDEVIGYVRDKYGADRVAQIITFGKLQARAVLRDVGRVLGMPYGYVDKICKLVPNNPANPVTLAQALDSEPQLQAMRSADPVVERLMHIALRLEGLFRNASTHAAGVVISDRPLTELVPLYRDPGAALPATQYNMKTVELAGLVKFDFLGLKTLDVLQQTVDILAARGVAVDLAALPLDDAKTFALMARGDTTGVFQLESSGMRDVLRRLRPERFEEIIALVALYRPGPMDNIPKFIKTKQGEEKPDYLHPLLEPVLRDTYGIPVYQEQVMQAAQVLAGYSLGNADLLRRAMGKKKADEMAAQRASFIAGAKKNKVSEAQAGAIFDQIDKFAGYGFNKSHAAAYALIAYQTAYLKANYAVEFFAASMNFEMGDTDKLNMVRQELARNAIALLPPDINRSHAAFAVEETESGKKAIRYALAALKGVGAAAMKSVVAAREADGPFKDLFDFASRADPKAMNKKQLESLAAAGAFDTLNRNRAQVLAAAEMLSRHASAAADERSSGQNNLFASEPEAAARPQLPDARNWDDLTRLQHEFNAIGFYLSAHPLDAYRVLLERMNVVPAAGVPSLLRASGPSRFKLAGVVMGKQERTSKSGNRFAFVQMSDGGGAFEVTVFSELLAASREQLETGSTLLIEVDAQIGGQQGGDDLRFIGRTFQPLKEAAERMSRGVRLLVRNTEALDALHKLLDGAQKGRGKVQLALELDDLSEAEIDLPEAYLLNESVKTALRQLPGGVEVQEF